MADEQLFSADVDGAAAPSEGRKLWKSCLTGCLVITVILLVVAVLVGYWIASNWRDWAATLGTTVIEEGVNSSQFSAEEKQQIMQQVERVAQAVREDTISGDQFQVLVKKLVESPLMSLIVTSTIEQHYFAKSGLTAEEKADGAITLRRFIRGSLDGKINEAGIDAAMAHVADRDANKQWKLRETLTDAELKAFLDEAKKQADAAGIPEQPADIDPSEEVKKIIDEALNAPAPVPAPVAEEP